MVKTVKTFGDYLRQFARSVDIVDERTIEEIRKLVYDYVRDELEAAYFSLACEQTVDSRPGLRTVWSTENEEHATTIRTLDGRYSSQISVSFDQRKPLWVVSRGEKPLRQANRAQVTGTRDAVSELQGILSTTKFPRLTKPQMFVAFSSRADDAVMGVVQEVLNEFSTILKIVQWNRIEQSGSITLQLIEQIAKSRFGLCYFSEPARDGGEFEDNPNVLFEAGMLHSLTNAPAGRPSGWVPVREKRSSRVPFDFASERIVIVPRNENGEVMEERFRSDLRRRMRALLSDDLAD